MAENNDLGILLIGAGAIGLVIALTKKGEEPPPPPPPNGGTSLSILSLTLSK